jgi:hypothetical protein
MNRIDTEKNRRILVIDDNPSIHDDLRKILCGVDTTNSRLVASEAIFFGHAGEESPLLDFEIDSAYQSQGSNHLRGQTIALAILGADRVRFTRFYI